ncbi:MAG: hypothetical protein AAF665_05905 [Pseudomonadota bacterium]
MTDATADNADAVRLGTTKISYMDQVLQHCLQGVLTLMIFFLLIVSGFNVGHSRQARSFRGRFAPDR